MNIALLFSLSGLLVLTPAIADAQTTNDSISRSGESASVAISDCPLGSAALSVDTPLFDILSNKEATEIIQQRMSGLIATLPPPISSTKLPSLSAIIPFRAVLRNVTERDVEKLDTALRAIVLSPDYLRLRCARYDGAAPPALPAVVKHPAIMVFDRSNGFRDDPSINAASNAIQSMAKAEGWQVVFTSHASSFNASDLGKFDAVIWNNVSGDVLSLSQRAAFRSYIENGGGFVGIHGSGGDPVTYWDWYVDTLIGARFKGHPHAPQFQSGRLVVAETGNAIVAGLGSGWQMIDEWYSFKTNPRGPGTHVLVTLDESSYQPDGPAGSLRMGDHPIAWTRCIGPGRSFYTAIGHLPESYSEASNSRLLRQGIEWATRRNPDDCHTEKE